MSLKVFAYGGGWQSNAALVLAAQGKLDYQTFLFCNVGDDSEDPLTLRYVREHAMPYAAAHGLELIELHRIKRDGSTETLFDRLTKPGSKSMPIPIRMSNGAPMGRSCTADFKVRVMGKWMKAHGATAADPATVALGISVDEIGRANASRHEPYERLTYPLLDLRIRRSDCPDIIRGGGLPLPPKSACWFCPFHSESAWIDMQRDRPALFTAATWLEQDLNKRQDEMGRDHVYLTRFGKPLREAIGSGQETLFDNESHCDSGHCFT